MKLNRIILIILTIMGCDNKIVTIDEKNNGEEVQMEAVEDIQLKVVNKVTDNKWMTNHTLAIDDEGNAWYTYAIEDTTVATPSYMDSPPAIQIRKYDGENIYIVYDFIKGFYEYIKFDKNGQLWLYNSKKIITITNENKLKTILELQNDEDHLQTLEFDNNNNIWASGLNTGLYNYKNDCWIKYTISNSSLPTNSINNIAINGENKLFLSLWGNKGIIKIENNIWTNYNIANSNITNQDFQDIEFDKYDNLWLATGWTFADTTLLKFEGNSFIHVKLIDENNSQIPGIVTFISFDKFGKAWIRLDSYSDYSRTWVSSTVATFDGTNFIELKNIADGNGINDIKFYQDKVYFATQPGIYIYDINSF